MNRMQRNSENGGQKICRNELELLQALDFAIQETVLYLDAYPNSTEALNYYHRLIKEREDVCNHYESTCGPLTIYGNTSTTSWDWINRPWPWEADAN